MSGACIITDEPLSQKQQDTIAGWFSINFFHRTGEENYRHLVPKVIVEQFLDFDGATAPKDYKLHCSKGRVTMIQVDEGRFTNHHRTFYSPDWRVLPFRVQKPKGNPIEKPANLSAMIEVAEKLSSNFSLIRVDLFSDGKQVRVGELTNCHANAGELFDPPEMDYLIGYVFDNPSLDIADLQLRMIEFKE